MIPSHPRLNDGRKRRCHRWLSAACSPPA